MNAAANRFGLSKVAVQDFLDYSENVTVFKYP